MPAIKCPTCEYRNYHAADICINCGTPLPSQAPPPLAKRPVPSNKTITHESSPNNKAIASELPSSGKKPTTANALPTRTSIAQEPSSPRKKPTTANAPSSPRNKPVTSELSPARQKPLTSKLSPAQQKPLTSELSPARQKPLTSELSPAQQKPISREQRTGRNRPSTKIEPVEPRPQTREEVDSDVESYITNAEPYEIQAETYFDAAVDESYFDDEIDEPYTKNKSHTKELVPYARESYGLVPSQSTALEPYTISAAMQEYLPQGILPSMPTFVKEEEREPWLDDKLPWGFPRRPPDVAGIIIQIQQSQELPEYPNLILGITNMLTELIWVIPNDTMKSQDERLQVTTVRIRVNDKIKKDARLIGYLRGANLTLGDAVSFWGWHRKGSLIVRKGYNHTSQAIVDTHTLGLVLPALTLLILLGIGFLLLLAWPSMSSGLNLFLHMAPHKP